MTAHSPTLPSLHLRHSSFSNPSVASPTSEFIIQPFFCFSYVTSSSLNELCSFSNLSITSPMLQLILQPFHHFTYVTAHYPTLLSLLLRHRTFTCVTWRAAHGYYATKAGTVLFGGAAIRHSSSKHMQWSRSSSFCHDGSRLGGLVHTGWFKMMDKISVCYISWTICCILIV